MSQPHGAAGAPTAPLVSVPERHFCVVTALANVRAAFRVASELLPGVTGVYTDEEARRVLRGLRRIEAKLTFVMGTIDEDELALALKGDDG
jgi:hypothetical protein